jgi:hypothetical protein
MGICRPGFHPRKAYTVKGTRVAASCVRKTTSARETHNAFVARTRGRMTRRLRGVPKTARGPSLCPPKKIRRNPYVRIRKGIRTFVPASCIANVGAPGKGLASGQPGIGPLRQGNLKRFGYTNVRKMSEGRRHLALGVAVHKYGSLTVWRKLNAIYVYTRRTSPASSAIFKADRDWVKTTYGIKAF